VRLGKGIALVILLGSPACVARMPHHGAAPDGIVRLDVGGTIERVPLEEYVRITVLSELAPAGVDAKTAARLFEVQAIVSRTYALTRRHAARDVWSGDDPPYLSAVADDVASVGAHAEWRFVLATPALIAALNADVRTRVGTRLQRVDVMTRDTAGRALLVALDGEQSPVIRGEELRGVLARAFGVRAVRSTRFDVRRTAHGFEFIGRGFGHGVGLCQAGMLARIRAGASPVEVLAHYFPGTDLR
jgi:peptidoglycan hydrolase-like amidase